MSAHVSLTTSHRSVRVHSGVSADGCVKAYIASYYNYETVYDYNAVKFGNDPSAGSPTETLLRLLLPLNDQV